MNHNVLLGNRSHERNALVKHRRYKSAECSVFTREKAFYYETQSYNKRWTAGYFPN